MPPSPVVITLRGWKEKQAICPWGLPIRLPFSIHPDLASRRAGRVFNQRNAMTIGHCEQAHLSRKASPFGG